MASKLERPLTSGIVTLQDLERRERANAAQPPPTYRQTMHGNPGGMNSGYSSFPADRQQPRASVDSYNNGSHMFNLMAPPNDNDVYAQADPVGPDAANSLGRSSQVVECPWCHARVNTKIKRRIGYKAGGAAVLIAAIAWPLFWVPLLIPGLHRKIHYCPECRRKIGRGRRSR
ncbi:hypothetical protein IW140_000569 [Coemansia sp. RSA 1813]|nr:hypothetical protein EV178_002700 [Coemansia sp. RSA 1646]KAJ1774038.1 hypothetical protein LPJ74_000137 [Coemansia sp. RSA 1843]KAJ2092572.1 hypothetical protein IW138_001010 [Coemansia sp. RSA 986]KAJ2216734.1 hypothetical protein EV179_001024 [Coemansia sp. RSA 487]KAJ2572806.1 hypothetical protein IW140_000569 [Coemansia sp. RSA 1813]